MDTAAMERQLLALPVQAQYDAIAACIKNAVRTHNGLVDRLSRLLHICTHCDFLGGRLPAQLSELVFRCLDDASLALTSSVSKKWRATLCRPAVAAMVVERNWKSGNFREEQHLLRKFQNDTKHLFCVLQTRFREEYRSSQVLLAGLARGNVGFFRFCDFPVPPDATSRRAQFGAKTSKEIVELGLFTELNCHDCAIDEPYFITLSRDRFRGAGDQARFRSTVTVFDVSRGIDSQAKIDKFRVLCKLSPDANAKISPSVHWPGETRAKSGSETKTGSKSDAGVTDDRSHAPELHPESGGNGIGAANAADDEGKLSDLESEEGDALSDDSSVGSDSENDSDGGADHKAAKPEKLAALALSDKKADDKQDGNCVYLARTQDRGVIAVCGYLQGAFVMWDVERKESHGAVLYRGQIDAKLPIDGFSWRAPRTLYIHSVDAIRRYDFSDASLTKAEWRFAVKQPPGFNLTGQYLFANRVLTFHKGGMQYWDLETGETSLIVRPNRLGDIAPDSVVARLGPRYAITCFDTLTRLRSAGGNSQRIKFAIWEHVSGSFPHLSAEKASGLEDPIQAPLSVDELYTATERKHGGLSFSELIEALINWRPIVAETLTMSRGEYLEQEKRWTQKLHGDCLAVAPSPNPIWTGMPSSFWMKTDQSSLCWTFHRKLPV